MAYVRARGVGGTMDSHSGTCMHASASFNSRSILLSAHFRPLAHTCPGSAAPPPPLCVTTPPHHHQQQHHHPLALGLLPLQRERVCAHQQQLTRVAGSPADAAGEAGVPRARVQRPSLPAAPCSARARRRLALSPALGSNISAGCCAQTLPRGVRATRAATPRAAATPSQPCPTASRATLLGPRPRPAPSSTEGPPRGRAPAAEQGGPNTSAGTRCTRRQQQLPPTAPAVRTSRPPDTACPSYPDPGRLQLPPPRPRLRPSRWQRRLRHPRIMTEALTARALRTAAQPAAARRPPRRRPKTPPKSTG